MRYKLIVCITFTTIFTLSSFSLACEPCPLSSSLVWAATFELSLLSGAATFELNTIGSKGEVYSAWPTHEGSPCPV